MLRLAPRGFFEVINDLREAPLVRRNSGVEHALYSPDFFCFLIEAVPIAHELDYLLLSYLPVVKLGFGRLES